MTNIELKNKAVEFILSSITYAKKSENAKNNHIKKMTNKDIQGTLAFIFHLDIIDYDEYCQMSDRFRI